ncbi:hypothetical protein [Helicobacter sp. 11S02629-2]|uniref:hypothetical protein n=1 Tax=Helicobacter sp. 11S02629-2 TaxID=1476195 RepID=UPI000BA705D3|nr:hypothetical protein [Helicobacter sp. 11S02629-2]PAF45622.1 hypothetical protein BKH40_01710 [Helicobacter sp. 11S02629-2]
MQETSQKSTMSESIDKKEDKDILEAKASKTASPSSKDTTLRSSLLDSAPIDDIFSTKDDMGIKLVDISEQAEIDEIKKIEDSKESSDVENADSSIDSLSEVINLKEIDSLEILPTSKPSLAEQSASLPADEIVDVVEKDLSNLFADDERLDVKVDSKTDSKIDEKAAKNSKLDLKTVKSDVKNLLHSALKKQGTQGTQTKKSLSVQDDASTTFKSKLEEALFDGPSACDIDDDSNTSTDTNTSINNPPNKTSPELKDIESKNMESKKKDDLKDDLLDEDSKNLEALKAKDFNQEEASDQSVIAQDAMSFKSQAAKAYEEIKDIDVSLKEDDTNTQDLKEETSNIPSQKEQIQSQANTKDTATKPQHKDKDIEKEVKKARHEEEKRRKLKEKAELREAFDGGKGSNLKYALYSNRLALIVFGVAIIIVLDVAYLLFGDNSFGILERLRGEEKTLSAQVEASRLENAALHKEYLEYLSLEPPTNISTSTATTPSASTTQNQALKATTTQTPPVSAK